MKHSNTDHEVALSTDAKPVENPVEMRVLTVRQPWAWALVHGGKDVENRTRNMAGQWRGPVAIHAGLSYDEDAMIWPGGRPLPIDEDGDHREPCGAIIGVAELVDVHHHSLNTGCYRPADVLGWVPADGSDITKKGWQPRTCSSWVDGSPVHLVFANPRPTKEPFAFRGGQGLRRLDSSVANRIMELSK